jgi:hypothetical protein
MSQPEQKFYEVQGAAKPVAGITFTPFDVIGSTLWGIYTTSDPAEIAALDKEMKENPKRGLSAITGEQYYAMAQKKIPSLQRSQVFRPTPVGSTPQPPQPPPAPQPVLEPPIKGAGAVVEANPAPRSVEEPVQAAAPVEITKSADLVQVDPSPTNPTRPSRKVKNPSQ